MSNKTIKVSFIKRNSAGEIEQIRVENLTIDYNRSTTAQILKYLWNQLPHGWGEYRYIYERINN